jgi:branched-chain amino acid transport system substrate-binding protein
VGPFKVKLVQRDTELKPAVGVRRVNEVIEKHKPMWVSSGCSSAVQVAMQDIIGNARGPVFWTEAGTTKLTAASHANRYSFRWASPTYAIAKSVMHLFIKNNPDVKSIFSMQMDYEYGYNMDKYSRPIMKELGVKLIENVFVPFTATDLSQFLTKAKASGADGLFMGFYGKLQATGLNQMHEFGLDQTMKVVNIYATVPTLQGVDPLAIKGTFFAEEWFPGMPNDWSRNFVEKYKKRWNSLPSNYAAQKYNECQLMEHAIKETKSSDPKDIILALEKIGHYQGPTGKEYLCPWQHQVHHDYLFFVGKSPEEKKHQDDFVKLIDAASFYPEQGESEEFDFDLTKRPF